MRRFLLIFPLLLLTAAKPGGGGSGGWKVFTTNLSRWAVSTAPVTSPDLATVQLSTSYANYTAFLVTNITGNISGKTITATFTVEVASGDPFYVWGGYNAPGNYGTVAEAGLYFSTHTDYPRNGSPSDPDNYWFTPNTRILVDDLLGTVTISCPVQPANWTQSFGARGSDRIAGFMSACQNVAVVGIAFGSNNFYDTGVGTTNGIAVLHLNSFQIQ